MPAQPRFLARPRPDAPVAPFLGGSPGRRRSRRTTAGTAARVAAVPLALAVVALGASAASAHVTVSPDTAAAGSYATLSFKVPNESANASTTRLEVDLPADTPFTSVSVEPVAGWTAKVTTADLPEPVDVHGTEVTQAPAKIVWTADDSSAAIDPGEFQRFTISAGAVPDGVDQVALPAVQTYSDGEVVRWEDPANDDGSEPEHPAPTLVVTPAEDDAHAGATTDDASAAPEASDDSAGTSSGTLALALGAAGLGLGLVGAVTGVLALRRSRADGDR